MTSAIKDNRSLPLLKGQKGQAFTYSISGLLSKYSLTRTKYLSTLLVLEIALKSLSPPANVLAQYFQSSFILLVIKTGLLNVF